MDSGGAKILQSPLDRIGREREKGERSLSHLYSREQHRLITPQILEIYFSNLPHTP